MDPWLIYYSAANIRECPESTRLRPLQETNLIAFLLQAEPEERIHPLQEKSHPRIQRERFNQSPPVKRVLVVFTRDKLSSLRHFHALTQLLIRVAETVLADPQPDAGGMPVDVLLTTIADIFGQNLTIEQLIRLTDGEVNTAFNPARSTFLEVPPLATLWPPRFATLEHDIRHALLDQGIGDPQFSLADHASSHPTLKKPCLGQASTLSSSHHLFQLHVRSRPRVADLE